MCLGSKLDRADVMRGRLGVIRAAEPPGFRYCCARGIPNRPAAPAKKLQRFETLRLLWRRDSVCCWVKCKPQKPALLAVLLQRLRALWEWGLYLGLMRRRFSRPDETRLVQMQRPSPDWLTQPLSIGWALCTARAAMISGRCGLPQSASASILRPVSYRIGEIRYSSQ